MQNRSNDILQTLTSISHTVTDAATDFIKQEKPHDELVDALVKELEDSIEKLKATKS